MFNDPEVLVLDEVTSAIDTITEEAVMKAINNLVNKKTIIIIAHRITTIKDCDEIYMLDSGEIVDHGNFAELTSKNIKFKEMAKNTA